MKDKYDFREEQLRPYLYNEVKEHESVSYEEPIPKLIEKLKRNVSPPRSKTISISKTPS